MREQTLRECQVCGRLYNAAKLKRCPVCQFAIANTIPIADVSDVEKSDSKPSVTKVKVERSEYSSTKMSYGSNARSNALIVNGYGLAIQIIGVIAGVISFIFCIYFGNLLHNILMGTVVGIVYGTAIILIALVSGALYRMISNYILFKTTD